jgi:serine/threonine protein kinase
MLQFDVMVNLVCRCSHSLPPLACRKYEYKGRRWKRISKQGKAFVDDLLVVDPDDRATSDEAMKASWLNRRFGATVRNPYVEEIESVKNSIVKYADYSKLRKVALMGECPTVVHGSTARTYSHFRSTLETDKLLHTSRQPQNLACCASSSSSTTLLGSGT